MQLAGMREALMLARELIDNALQPSYGKTMLHRLQVAEEKWAEIVDRLDLTKRMVGAPPEDPTKARRGRDCGCKGKHNH